MKILNIFFGKEKIGRIEGLNFRINPSFKYSKNIFNNKILDENLELICFQIVDSFILTKNQNFDFKIDGSIIWKDHKVAEFTKGKEIHNPKISIFVDKYFSRYQSKINKKLNEFFLFKMNQDLHYKHHKKIKKYFKCFKSD